MRIIAVLFCWASLSFGASLPTINKMASEIDNVLNVEYTKAGVKPNALINDDKFVRRAYLSIVGRIPTYAEYEQFSKLNAPNKRTELVRYLVNAKGYSSNLFNFWVDSLRLRDRINNVNFLNGSLYMGWIKQQIEANLPYDQFVKQILTSSGDYFTNPATGYYERDVGMPLDNLIATMKVFAGINISCAQCHDDPFQDWRQSQFYQMAAMFVQGEPSGRRNPAAREKVKQIREEIEKLVKDDVKLRGLNNQVNNFLSASLTAVNVDPNRKIKLPFDYRYADFQPNEVMQPKVLFGEHEIKYKDDMRQDAAEWLTSPEHPTFTKNIVNRYWGFIFGNPIIQNVESIDTEKASPLLNVLEKIFKELNYSTRDFIQVLCSTQVFQRENYVYPVKENFVFIGPVESRLSAEQFWDSVLAIVLDNPEYFKSTYGEEYKATMNVDNFDSLTLADVRNKINQIQDVNKKKYYGAQNYKGYNLIRASEVMDNAAPNNILTSLGRGDRELINSSSREGNVTQVISLINGQISDIVNKKDSVLENNIKGKTPADKMEIVFKSILSRKPTIAEKSIFAKASDQDLVWALINSQEFKFN